MAEPITITCPECAKAIKAPAEILGKRIKCKNCEAVFVAKADKPKGAIKPGKPAKPAKPADLPIPLLDEDDAGDEDDGKAYGMTETDLAPRCPECANEMEGPEAVVCLHCGFNTQTRLRAERKRVREVTGGRVFLWLLPGIVCAVLGLASVSWAMFEAIYYLAWGVPAYWTSGDADSAQLWKNCYCCFQVWWFVFLLFVGYKCIRFAVSRLILNNKPPDIEEK